MRVKGDRDVVAVGESTVAPLGWKTVGFHVPPVFWSTQQTRSKRRPVAVSATVGPLSADHLGTGAMMLDLTDVDAMKAGLAERSDPNFMRVVRDAAARSGFDAVDYLGLLHMKRSAHVAVLAELGMGEEASF